MLPEEQLQHQRYGALLLKSSFLLEGNRVAIRDKVGGVSDVQSGKFLGKIIYGCMNECSKHDTNCILFPIAIQSTEI